MSMDTRGSGHSIVGNSSILDGSSQILEPMAGTTQPRPVPCYKVYILYLMGPISD
jgi:hypothetical protein